MSVFRGRERLHREQGDGAAGQIGGHVLAAESFRAGWFEMSDRDGHVCFICGVPIKEAWSLDEPFDPVRTPVCGNLLEIKGNYGSSVFDTFGDTFLRGAVCESCLIERADRLFLMSRDWPRGCPDAVYANHGKAKVEPPFEHEGKVYPATIAE